MKGLSGVFFIWTKSNWRQAKHWYLPLFIKNLTYTTAYTAETSIKSMSGTERMLAILIVTEKWLLQLFGFASFLNLHEFHRIPWARAVNYSYLFSTPRTYVWVIEQLLVLTRQKASPANEVRQKANFEYHQRAEMVVITDADQCHTLGAAIACYCINKNPPLESQWIPKNPLRNLCYTHCTDHSNSLKYITLFKEF